MTVRSWLGWPRIAVASPEIGIATDAVHPDRPPINFDKSGRAGRACIPGCRSHWHAPAAPLDNKPESLKSGLFHDSLRARRACPGSDIAEPRAGDA
jgi:hypothetical protein